MDKNVIKKYAVWAREQLIEKVTARAVKYEIVDERDLNESLETVGGEVLSETERKQRKALIQRIKAEGYSQVMEEVAYTWFNRFVAIRFMEVNGYLPSYVRVFSDESGAFKPQILAEAIHLDLPGLDLNKVMQYKEDANEEELFKYLLKIQCNALNEILPQMFQKIEDYTELLLPDFLLREGSVIEKLVNEIPEDNFDVNTENGQIEVIGWMYQYYISAKHEEVVDPLHGKVVNKEEVPAATQLFTTDWVVRYLIDNSVGRYWVERNPESKLADNLTYFVKPKDGVIKTVDEKITPQDVTVFDPCVGSGHFLVYAFDVLMKIYVEYGYSERDAAAEIVKNNLFGLDIDGRAAQLAYFAVMMKARQYDRRFLTKKIQPNVYEITESNNADIASIEHFYENDSALKKDIEAILDVLRDAKEYGSILQMPEADFEKINARFAEIDSEISMYKAYLLSEFKLLLSQAEIMSRKYAVVATNPPYMNKYDNKLKEYINANYKDYSGDLFSVFMFKNFIYCVDGGYTGFMTPFVWMFIKTYEPLRNYIISNKHIETLIQFEYSAYEEATVPICSFVLKNIESTNKGYYFRLSEFTGGMEVQRAKIIEAQMNKDCGYYYETNQRNYFSILEEPIAYWAGSAMVDIFARCDSLKEIAKPRKGLDSADNNRFVRHWYEVSFKKLNTCAKNREDAKKSRCKWFPVNSGGDFRKWYGNFLKVINWENDGKEIQEYPKAYVRAKDFYFREGISWTKISSSKLGVRYAPEGLIFDSAGQSLFPVQSEIYYILALLCSKIAFEVCKILNPTLNYQVGDFERIPVDIRSDLFEEISNKSRECVSLSKDDWDSFETSWDFEIHPLVDLSKGLWDATATAASMDYYYGKLPKTNCPIETCYLLWQGMCNERFKKLKKNEEDLNRLFIDIYGLRDELTSEVEEKDVTVRKADLQRDIRSLISYAVGCMFGRYSVDTPGLIYAGGEWDDTKYDSFKPDADAIIPICDDEYFEDDMAGRFITFIETVFGKESLEDNLKYIADALGGKGSAREVIRNYFLNDFYADHLKLYQKRPIYWLFDSGKKNGFKCLVYMHRYKADTIARIRTDYVHEQQARYRTAIEEIEKRIESSSASEKIKLDKKLNTLKAQDEEIHAYEEKIHHLADQMISINLDDGVKHNYELFKDVLAKIK